MQGEFVRTPCTSDRTASNGKYWGGLQREVLYEDVVRYALTQFKQQLQERLEGTRSQLAVLRTERERLKEEIGNLASVIATGRHSPALLAELEKRKRRLDEKKGELFPSVGGGGGGGL